MSKKIYWGDEEEKLIILIKGDIKNNNLLIKIIPKLKKMIGIILNRYYGGNFLTCEEEFYIDNCLSHLYTKIPKFKEDKGTAYSYLSTIIKYYFYDVFVNNKEKKQDFVGLETVDLDYHDDPIESMEDMYYDMIEHVQSKIDLYSKKKYHKKHESSNKRNLNIMYSIIEKLEEKKNSERIIIELYEENDLTPKYLNNVLTKLGFKFSVGRILNNYLDCEEVEFENDWLNDKVINYKKRRKKTKFQ